MDNDIRVEYTQAAKDTINKVADNYRNKLVSIALNKKRLPGEAIIEITASDIENAARYLIFIMPNKYDKLKLLFSTYAIVGLVITIVSMFYKELHSIFINDPIQGMLLFTGSIILLLGYFGLLFIKIKEKQVKTSKSIRADHKP